MLSQITPLKQKINVNWKYNPQVFSPANPDIEGQLNITFLKSVDDVGKIEYGLVGRYKFNYNYIHVKKGGTEGRMPFSIDEKNVLFNEHQEIVLPQERTSVEKNETILQTFKVSFPSNKTFLPSSCTYYGDELQYDPTLSVDYKLYVRISYRGSFLKRDKTETIEFPVNYQASALHPSAVMYIYREPIVLDVSGGKKKASKLLQISKNNTRDTFPLVVQQNIPAYVDLNKPLFKQLTLKFIIEYPMDNLIDKKSTLEIRAFKLSIHYTSNFFLHQASATYKKKKTMLELDLKNAKLDFKEFAYDEKNSHYFLDYQIVEYPDLTIRSAVGLQTFLTNGVILDNKFKNQSCLHLAYNMKIKDGDEKIIKFQTESSLDVECKYPPAYESNPDFEKYATPQDEKKASFDSESSI